MAVPTKLDKKKSNDVARIFFFIVLYYYNTLAELNDSCIWTSSDVHHVLNAPSNVEGVIYWIATSNFDSNDVHKSMIHAANTI
jgi:hypothetical protein